MGYTKGFVQRYKGSFLVIKKVDKVSYKEQLSSTLKLHLVFHVSCLKPYYEDSSRREFKRAPIGITNIYDKDMEFIMPDRVVRGKTNHPSHEYLVK